MFDHGFVERNLSVYSRIDGSNRHDEQCNDKCSHRCGGMYPAKCFSLREIPERVMPTVKNEWEIILPQTKKEKVVITTCSTGIGTAVQISNLLEKSIPDHLQIRILPYEFNQLENREHVKQALTSYDIVGVVGTNKPRQELAPFIL